VTGQDLKAQASNPGEVSARYAIIVGTAGKSAWIDALTAKKKIDITPIAGGWERYMIETVDNPAPGIKKAIVVAGSDRRGTAFHIESNRSLSLVLVGRRSDKTAEKAGCQCS